MSSEDDPPVPIPAAAASAENAEEADAAGVKKRALTPEEQMALYEESLKEDDWGHQPC